MRVPKFFLVAFGVQTLLSFVANSPARADELQALMQAVGQQDLIPEHFIRSIPNLKIGPKLGSIRDIKKPEDLKLNGKHEYTRKQVGKTGREATGGSEMDHWLGIMYKENSAWLHSRGAQDALAQIAKQMPPEMKNRIAKEIAKPAMQKKIASIMASSAPSAVAPVAPKPASKVVSAAPTVASAPPPAVNENDPQPPAPRTRPLASVPPPTAEKAVVAASALPAAKAEIAAPAVPAKAAAECAQTKEQYQASEKLKKAFGNTPDPFSQWAGPSGSTLAPNKKGQWDVTWNGMKMRTIPMQICVEKEQPYVWVFNKKFDIKSGDASQSFTLSGAEGSGEFTRTVR